VAQQEVTIKGLDEAGVVALSEAYGEPDWLRDKRQEAFKAFSDLDWPHKRVEEWRYTDPARFDLDRPVLTAAGTGGAARGPFAVAAGELAATIRVVDGGVGDAQIGDESRRQGLVVTDLATAAREHPDVVRSHLGSVVGTDTKHGAASLAAFTGGVLVHVPANVVIERPIVIEIEAGSPGTIAPRILVVTEHHAVATVYVDHVGDAQATVLEVVEAVVGEESRLNLVTAQHWGPGVDMIAAHKGRVGRSGDYRHLEVTLGGGTVYITPDVRLDGEGGNAELLGLYFTDEGQHFEHRTLIHHDASHTTSETIYKGALQGDSKATWYGNIRIEPHAKATSSDETNRNLILTDRARANTIPFLEILTSDVSSCGHHSSVGQVDELQLFYLESRGIPRAEAVRMLVFGFFAEVTDRVDLPGVAETVTAEIEDEIAATEMVVADPRRS
jgi:Fe-S cluster assembly protein SufD